jgi:inactivated superfamily I helicase
MDPEQQELRIAALLDALDQEHGRVREAMAELKATGAALRQDVKSSAALAVQDALKALQADIQSARGVMTELHRFSLWRAAWQHAMVALVAIMVTLLAVWAYVPPVSDMNLLRAQQAQLQASIEDLNQRGAKVVLGHCGPKKRLCVAVDESAGIFGEIGEPYRIAKGY